MLPYGNVKKCFHIFCISFSGFLDSKDSLPTKSELPDNISQMFNSDNLGKDLDVDKFIDEGNENIIDKFIYDYVQLVLRCHEKYCI